MTNQFACLKRREQCQLRLFCFPHAGGTPFAYYSWPDHMPQTVEIWVAQMAGRAARVGEAPSRTMAGIIDDFLPSLTALLDVPFAMFGHSLGAIVSFELARLLEQRGVRPVTLFVSASRPPHLKAPEPVSTREMSDEAFLRWLQELNGRPAEALDCLELMRFVLPAVRADFEVAESYQYLPSEPLDTQIVALGGEADSHVSALQIAEWKHLTGRHFTMKMFPGDHFYLNHSTLEVCRLITSELSALQPAAMETSTPLSPIEAGASYQKGSE